MTDDDSKKTNLPALRPRSRIAKSSHKPTKKQGAFLAKIRAAKATPPVAAKPPGRGDSALVAAALKPRKTRPRLVFAIDATASREPAWAAAKATTDTLFSALPGQLDVALAVHGGSRVKLFTEFTPEPAALRDRAAGIACEAGITRLVEIMDRCRDVGDVKVLVYIGDVFEEELQAAELVAAALRLRGTRIVVLHDRAQAPRWDASAEAFQAIAKLTDGAVLPFDPASTAKLREILEAIATLAVGGVKLLQARTKALPAAELLLKHLPDGDR